LGETIFLVYVLGVYLVPHCFTNKMVHEPGFSGCDFGDVEQDLMGKIIVVLFYC
jgi:hypothetical protein